MDELTGNESPHSKSQGINPDDEFNRAFLIMSYVIDKELGLSFINDINKKDASSLMFVLASKCLNFVYHGTDATPEKAHEFFINKMKSAGWAYGSEVDISNKKHPDLLDWKDFSRKKRRDYSRIAKLVQEGIESVDKHS